MANNNIVYKKDLISKMSREEKIENFTRMFAEEGMGHLSDLPLKEKDRIAFFLNDKYRYAMKHWGFFLELYDHTLQEELSINDSRDFLRFLYQRNDGTLAHLVATAMQLDRYDIVRHYANKIDETVDEIVPIAKKVEPSRPKENGPVALSYSGVENAPVLLSSSHKFTNAPVVLGSSRNPIIPGTVYEYSVLHKKKLSEEIFDSAVVNSLVAHLGIEPVKIDRLSRDYGGSKSDAIVQFMSIKGTTTKQLEEALKAVDLPCTISRVFKF